MLPVWAALIRAHAEVAQAQRGNRMLAGVISNRRQAGTMVQVLAGSLTSRNHQGRYTFTPANFPGIFEHNKIRNQAVGQAGPQT